VVFDIYSTVSSDLVLEASHAFASVIDPDLADPASANRGVLN
jgi:hypothetical protein